MIPINITLDGESILDYIESCDITLSGGTSNSISISLAGNQLWEKTVPTDKQGELRLKVFIGDTTYSFLLEEREASSNRDGLSYSIWGRSEHAWLSAPFAGLVTDTYDTQELHPWQMPYGIFYAMSPAYSPVSRRNHGHVYFGFGTRRITRICTVQDCIDYLLFNYCLTGSQIEWAVENYTLSPGVMAVSGQDTLTIVSNLAAAIGAEIVAHPDGRLIIQTYTATPPGTFAAEYFDIDGIVSLSERVEQTAGYDSIVIYGYSPAQSNDEDEEEPEPDPEPDPEPEVPPGCGGIVAEWAAPGATQPGETEYVYVYGSIIPSSASNSAGTNVEKLRTENVTKTETDVSVENGEGSLKYPYCQYPDNSVRITLNNNYRNIFYSPAISLGARDFKIASLKTSPHLILHARYPTKRTIYKTFIPTTYDSATFTVSFTFPCGEVTI